MIAHISKNTNGKYIATSSTLETAKLHQGTIRVYKVDTETAGLFTHFLAALELLDLSPKDALEELLTARLDAPRDDLPDGHWDAATDYGDGEWVIYKGRRLYAMGRGNIPSSRGE